MTEVAAQRAESLRSEFARRCRRQVAVLICAVLTEAAFVLWIAGLFSDADFLSWGPYFAVGVCGLFVAHHMNWRCPACTEAPGEFRHVRFCQACGVNLR